MRATVESKSTIDLSRWFKAMGPWFRRGRYFWFVLLLPIAALVIALFVGGPEGLEDRIRLAGLTLNVVGLVVVAIELARTQGHFRGHAGVGLLGGLKLAVRMTAEWIGSYFREVPRWRSRNIVLNIEGDSISMVGGVSAASTGIASGQSLDERVRLLEALQKADRKAIDAVTQQASRNTQALSDLKADVERKHRETHEKFADFATGGIPAQAMGWFLLLVGTVLDGASKEVACLLKALVL